MRYVPQRVNCLHSCEILLSSPATAMNVPWKRRRKDACSTYIKGKSRTPHQLRNDLKRGLRHVQAGVSVVHTTGNATTSASNGVSSCSALSGAHKHTHWSPCTTCDPVLKQLKPHFESLVRQGLDLRKRKRILPTPKKPDKLHYRKQVAQNRWVRCNMFELLVTISTARGVSHHIWVLEPSDWPTREQ